MIIKGGDKVGEAKVYATKREMELQSQLTEKEALLKQAVGLLLAIQQEYQFLTVKEFLAKLKAGGNNG